MPNFIVSYYSYCLDGGPTYLKVEPPNQVTFIDNKSLANSYPSRYAAKMHLRNLEGVPDNVKIIER